MPITTSQCRCWADYSSYHVNKKLITRDDSSKSGHGLNQLSYSATIAYGNKERHEGAFGEMASSLVSRKAEDILLVELTVMMFSMSRDDMRREQKQMFFSQRH